MLTTKTVDFSVNAGGYWHALPRRFWVLAYAAALTAKGRLIRCTVSFLEDCMTADGNWNLVVSTPMGERLATLSVKTEGGTLKGSQVADGNSAEIFDGTVNGNEVSWKVSITEPMPMTLEFNGTVNGDELSGFVTLGAFGNSSFSGARG